MSIASPLAPMARTLVDLDGAFVVKTREKFRLYQDDGILSKASSVIASRACALFLKTFFEPAKKFHEIAPHRVCAEGAFPSQYVGKPHFLVACDFFGMAIDVPSTEDSGPYFRAKVRLNPLGRKLLLPIAEDTDWDKVRAEMFRVLLQDFFFGPPAGGV